MPGAWRTVRVFISSTFKDMQAERDMLGRFVFPRLREELLKRRIYLVDEDLRGGAISYRGHCRRGSKKENVHLLSSRRQQLLSRVNFIQREFK
jgi:hypothetical protein